MAVCCSSDLSVRGSARSSDQQGVFRLLAARIVPQLLLAAERRCWRPRAAGTRGSQPLGPSEGLLELAEVRGCPQTSSELRYHARAPLPPSRREGEGGLLFFLSNKGLQDFGSTPEQSN